jgi:hypothetical protein
MLSASDLLAAGGAAKTKKRPHPAAQEIGLA